MEFDYAAFVGSPLPGLIDPRALRGQKSDARLALQKSRPPQRYVRGLDSWTIWALDAMNAPSHGTGKNGAWTKADFDALAA